MESRKAYESYEPDREKNLSLNSSPVHSIYEYCQRGNCNPASRVLRRRCKSEGLERSPYDMSLTDTVIRNQHYAVLNQNTAQSNNHLDRVVTPKNNWKSSKEQNCQGQVFHISHSPQRHPINYGVQTVLSGDCIGIHEKRHTMRHSPTRSPRHARTPHNISHHENESFIANMVTSAKLEKGSSRLPKVEELFEKMDSSELHSATKLPLKSIVNNSLDKNIPTSILKKNKVVKTSTESKPACEGRRRQRALSESEYTNCPFDVHYRSNESHSKGACIITNTKRAKDNTGSGYSYGISGGTDCAHILASKTPNPVCKHTFAPFDLNGAPTHYVDVRHLNAGQLMLASHIVKTSSLANHISEGVDNAAKPIPSSVISATANTPVVKKAVRPASWKGKMRAGNRAHTVKTKNGMTNELPVVEVIEIEEDSVLPKPQSLKSVSPRWTGNPDVVMEDVPVNGKVTDMATLRMLSTALSNGVIVSPRPKVNNENSITNNKPKVRSPKKDPRSPVNRENSITNNKPKVRSPKKGPRYPVYRDLASALPETLVNCVRFSLFPRVPPYLKFVGHDTTPVLRPPVAVQKHLKWKVTTITPVVVKKTLINSGFKLVRSECDTSENPQEETVDWVGIWGKHMKSLLFRGIKDGQKMNHFPGTFQIGRKDRLWRNLHKLYQKYGEKEFDLMPRTYVLPHDLKMLKHDWEKYAARNEKWIIKPPASARGAGIKVVSRWTQIPKRKPVVVQKYVSKPYLINGSKFDLRLYVLVTSMHPLRIYLYKDGLARFASVKYSDELASLHDRYMHLTNYSINRLSKSYTQNEDANACQGHKWTIQALLSYLKKERNVNTDELWESIKDMVIKTIISGEASISSLTKTNMVSRYNCYELFGIDVLLDENLKPWLLEVNISPSLHSASPLDLCVKGPLVTAVLNIAQFQIPNKVNLDQLNKDKHTHCLSGLPYDPRLYTVYLSKDERDKHLNYAKMEEREEYLDTILTSLTPDDVRHLIQAEDELTQCTDGLDRIFPTYETHKYLEYLTGPRYYNRLFDAWEHKYSRYRSPGIEMLTALCEIGVHLEVPPLPLKNDVDAPEPEEDASVGRGASCSASTLAESQTEVRLLVSQAQLCSCGPCSLGAQPLPLQQRA